MKFDTKIALVIRDGLDAWQELNIAAFIAGGIAASTPELIGEPYKDRSGIVFSPMFGQPVLVFRADAAGMKAAFERARARSDSSRMPLYTRELFSTGNDEDNRAAVAGVDAEDFDLAGFGVHDAKRVVDEIVKGLRLHP